MSAALSITAFCAMFPVLVLIAPLLLDALERKLLVPAVEDGDGDQRPARHGATGHHELLATERPSS